MEKLEDMSSEELANKLGIADVTENDGLLVAVVKDAEKDRGNVKIACAGVSFAHMLGVAQVLMKTVLANYADEDQDTILKVIVQCHVALLSAVVTALDDIDDPEQYRVFAAAVNEYTGLGEDNGQEEQNSSED